MSGRPYEELLEKDFARQIKYLNIDQYHNLGYKGKGFTILNTEGVGEHREMTSQVLRDFTPEVTVLEGHPSGRISGDKLMDYGIMMGNKKITFEELIEKHNVKIFTRSYASPMSKTLSDYYKKLQQEYGVIFLCSAGNEEGDIGAWSKYNTAITVSASTLKSNGEITISYAQSQGEVDFTMFMAKGKGTSAASPALASFIALLLQRYGDFNQAECVEILKSIAYKLPNIEDHKQGWGLPILPLTDKLEIIIGGTPMVFKDIEKTRWSKPAIDRCVAEGLLVGFEDGTFRPTENVTREQFAQILVRILDKIK